MVVVLVVVGVVGTGEGVDESSLLSLTTVATHIQVAITHIKALIRFILKSLSSPPLKRELVQMKPIWCD